MTRLEELEARKRKIEEYFQIVLKNQDSSNSYMYGDASPDHELITREHRKVVDEIARIKFDEYVNIDAVFEKEVLK